MARVIVPLSPKNVNFKTQAILKHQSQKDGAKYLGDDKREFWERAKDRNRGFAELLNKLGFPNY
jgi:glucosamine-6-phosphate deaminase